MKRNKIHQALAIFKLDRFVVYFGLFMALSNN